jgi:adenosylcobinamide-phosphate synthase
LLFILKIYIAYILDLIFGDPYRIPHPVQAVGLLISFLERKLISFPAKKFFGMILNLTVLAVTFIICFFLQKFAVVEIYLMYTVFSVKCLADEGRKVYRILKEGNLAKARKELSYLVSRDTESLEKNDIIRSTMETISENTVDGVIAPMIFMFIGGLPLAMVYKAINTMDSMLGYKNEKYGEFGYFSAKLDDAANFIPARITGGLLIPAACFFLRYDYKNAWRIFFRDRKNHASPNSAHPEAAVAGALGVQFGGKTSYFGKLYDKPVIGDKKREFQTEDIRKNIKILYVTGFLGLIMCSAVYAVILKIF